MQDFHLVVMSYVDTERFPNNKPSRFCNSLAFPVEVKGNWSVGLEEFVCIRNGKTVKSMAMFVCCNLISDSFVGNKLMPLLRTVRNESIDGISFDRVNYRQIERSFINSIEVEIRDEYNEIFPLADDDKVMLVLHFKKLE